MTGTAKKKSKKKSFDPLSMNLSLSAFALILLGEFLCCRTFSYGGSGFGGLGIARIRRSYDLKAFSSEALSEMAVDRSNPRTFTLPIFPLRKSVMLPTSTLNLNLYEDRYLKMAEDVMNSG